MNPNYSLSLYITVFGQQKNEVRDVAQGAVDVHLIGDYPSSRDLTTYHPTYQEGECL